MQSASEEVSIDPFLAFPCSFPKGQALHRLFRRVRETGAAIARSSVHRAVKKTEEITDALLGGGARFVTLRRLASAARLYS